MSSNMQAITSWLILIILTIVSVYLSELIYSPPLFLTLVFTIVFIKGQQITDVFMELNRAPKKWRIAFLCYVLMIPLIICLIYLK